jgi:hypothetical protein
MKARLKNGPESHFPGNPRQVGGVLESQLMLKRAEGKLTGFDCGAKAESALSTSLSF